MQLVLKSIDFQFRIDYFHFWNPNFEVIIFNFEIIISCLTIQMSKTIFHFFDVNLNFEILFSDCEILTANLKLKISGSKIPTFNSEPKLIFKISIFDLKFQFEILKSNLKFWCSESEILLPNFKILMAYYKILISSFQEKPPYAIATNVKKKQKKSFNVWFWHF